MSAMKVEASIELEIKFDRRQKNG